MSKQKTAMQKLLLQFKEENKSGWFSFDEIEQTILDFGLKLEKEQIENIYDKGFLFGVAMLKQKQEVFVNGEKYYNETFEIEVVS
jgi:hypothetical protein